MKKVVLSILIVILMAWSCGTVVAKNKGKGKEKTKAARKNTVEKAEKKTNRKIKTETEDTDKPKRRHRRRAKRRDKAARKEKSKRSGAPGEKGPAKRQDKAARKERSKRSDAVGEKGQARRKNRKENAQKAARKGRNHQQQLRAVDKQITHEQEKHHNRVARLQRIRQLAQEKGKTDTVERIDKLLAKEQKRFDAKQKRMNGRKERILLRAEEKPRVKIKTTAEEDVDKSKPRTKRRGWRKVKRKEKPQTEEPNE